MELDSNFFTDLSKLLNELETNKKTGNADPFPSNLEKLDIPLKLYPGSKDRSSFEIAIDDRSHGGQLLYNRKMYSSFNISNPEYYGNYNFSEKKLENNIKDNLRDFITQDFEEYLDSDGLKELQQEFIKETDSFITNDFKLARPNTLTTNFVFDCLNGELKDALSSTIDYESKNFSMESGHHEPGGKTAAFKKSKTKLVGKGNTLEGNPEIKSIKDIDKEIAKWNEISFQLFEEDTMQLLDVNDSDKLINNSADILDILNLASHIGQEEANKHHSRPELQYNKLWTSISQYFDKPEQKTNGEAAEEPQTKEEEEDWLDEELDNQQIQINLEQIAGKNEPKVEEQTEMQKLFEKNLGEGSIKINKLPEKATTMVPVKSQYKWAVQDNTDLTNFYDILPKSKFAIQYPFELDDFQKRAILHLENKESVFVAAHTSAGKTVVAEYAIALARKHMTRAVYTSPIKALSNQKYRDFTNKFDSVGILTGDVSLHPEATCLIVTTEVLRSMLYKGSDIIRDIEWVIFDEVHYVNNAERGVVWEETIIMLPEHIGIIMLSATVPNAMEFANWVGMTKKRKIFVQTTYKRPTPLEHSIYLNNEFQIIKNKNGNFLQKEYEMWLNNLDKAKKNKDELRERRRIELIEKFDEKGWKFKDDEKKKFFQKKQLDKAVKTKGEVPVNLKGGDKSREESARYYELIRHCEKEKLLPCVIFAFSKKKCMERAFGLMGLDLCTKQESNKIVHFFNNAIKRLKPVDRELPQLVSLRELLKRGIAVHHGDLLPIAKEIVEILFADGLIKVLFATETFAMGVNMPAKTVIFSGLKKNDGKDFRYLKSSEYTQMSGRAGRRGLDEKGTVIIFIRDSYELPRAFDLKEVVDQKGEELQSKFRLTYGIIFNLLLAKEINVVEVMKRSFVEHGKVAALPEQQKKLKEYEKQLQLLEKNFQCKVKPFDKNWPIEDYWNHLEALRNAATNLWTNPIILSKLTYPRFATVLGKNGEIDYGVLLGVETSNERISFRCMTTEYARENKSERLEISYEEEYKSSIKNMSGVIGDIAYRIYSIPPSDLLEVFEEKTNLGKVDKDVPKKMQQEIAERLKEARSKLNKVKNDKDFFAFQTALSNKNDPDIMEAYKQIKAGKERLMKHECHKCDMKFKHLDILHRRFKLVDDIASIKSNLSEDNLAYMDQFEARIRILQELNYLDENQIPLIKARVGRELGSSDIFLCEVIMENILIDLSPEEVAALLSGFVCQVKKTELDFNDLLPDTLKEAMDRVDEIAEKIIDLERKYHVTIEDEESYKREKINFDLVKVVYEWACQKDFAEVCQLTDAQEGSIVRTILRLDILLRDLKSACKVMGNMKLLKLIKDASHLIRRDIVFAGSLYLE